jgi:kinetochore protein Spc24
MATQDVFEEHLGVIAALKDNYARKDDAHAVSSVLKLQEEISQLCCTREEQVKTAIKGECHATRRPRRRAAGPPLLSRLSRHAAELTKSVRESEIAATYPEAEGAHSQRVAALASASVCARQGVESLTRQLGELQQRQEELKEKIRALRKKSEHIEQIVSDAEPRTRCVQPAAPGRDPRVAPHLTAAAAAAARRHELSLYAHVSKITWQFDQQGTAAGTVSDPDAGNIRKFEFALDTTPPFEVTNRLWELLQ